VTLQQDIACASHFGMACALLDSFRGCTMFIDLAILAVVVVAALRGWSRGAARELVGPGSLALAMLLALRVSSRVALLLVGEDGAGPIPTIFSFLLVLGLSWGALFGLDSLRRKLVAGLPDHGLDRLVGGVSSVAGAVAGVWLLFGFTLTVCPATGRALQHSNAASRLAAAEIQQSLRSQFTDDAKGAYELSRVAPELDARN
jgi:uncharacterized membrane protein required for colicin V production